MANYHISRKGDREWNVLREGADRVSMYEETQREAEIEAKRLAANSGGGEVKIHGLNGRIRDSDTIPPAIDPFPQRDLVH